VHELQAWSLFESTNLLSKSIRIIAYQIYGCCISNKRASFAWSRKRAKFLILRDGTLRQILLIKKEHNLDLTKAWIKKNRVSRCLRTSEVYKRNMNKEATEAWSRKLPLDVFQLVGSSHNVIPNRWGIYWLGFN